MRTNDEIVTIIEERVKEMGISMSEPLLLEIDELITFNKDPYYMEIDLNEL